MSAPDSSSAHPPGGGVDWRESIAQSFRSGEVRSIAKVLASLEPGATSASKTMLAMRFEESIFKAASGLDDYRKTIQKRLKRLQKHYAKQQQQQKAGGGGEGKDNKAANDDLVREKELVLESELRDKYGVRLLYIAEHADQAVALTREKHDARKADVLQQHAANAKQWAVQIGLELPANCSGRDKFARQERRDMAYLNKLRTYLETRVENIRSHVVKLTDPDAFLEEALVKVDDAALKERLTEVFRGALEKADPDSKSQFTEDMMRSLVERMNATVPIPRRNQEGDRVRAAAARIEKVRAAAQAMYIYMGLPVSAKTHFIGSLAKCHTVVIECLTELEGEYKHLVKELDDKDEQGKRIIQLEDAWNNPMQFSTEGGEDLAVVDADGDESDAKGQKTEADSHRGKVPMVIRSRYLLTRGRKTFPTLLPALKRKRATLVRDGSTTFVRLEFGKVFEMTIYLVPLLVTIRAMSKETPEEESPTDSLAGGHHWPSLYQGLRPSEKDLVQNSGGTVGNKNSTLSVLGVTGSYETLGPIIAKKLEYASAQTTYVLRRCFAEATVGKAALTKSEFEIEILEAGALIRFLQIARSTYVPGWVDDDV